METEVILVRHGETEWNRDFKFQGSKDIELSAEGKEQGAKLAARFASEKIDKVYSSNLTRAYQTASLVAEKHDLEVIQVDGLQEINFGKWEGMTYQEINKEFDFTVDEWMKDPANKKPPAGESLKQLEKRTVKALEKVLEEEEGNKIVIVSHGGVIRTLLCNLLEMPLSKSWRLKQSNTAVNILKFYEGEESVILELFNSTVHLND
ncbi:alpha-ribazole phosphatase [Natroniella sulfidigena]|uniref:alpha-ribazole phosphatase n=1 Tax=Natroniella sulfidigena TaxID=723921 RepID=UPI00200AC293|nr:alpha-ribazole phosphatase [Natroniella sulfidigena]MCK8817384.1 alpha-ribazole phosphatase [Natroniella sulfidigena]